MKTDIIWHRVSDGVLPERDGSYLVLAGFRARHLSSTHVGIVKCDYKNGEFNINRQYFVMGWADAVDDIDYTNFKDTLWRLGRIKE